MPLHPPPRPAFVSLPLWSLLLLYGCFFLEDFRRAHQNELKHLRTSSYEHQATASVRRHHAGCDAFACQRPNKAFRILDLDLCSFRSYVRVHCDHRDPRSAMALCQLWPHPPLGAIHLWILWKMCW